MPSSSRMPCLPAGFRFHPTDEELIVHYLMNQAASVPCPVPIIAEVNIYQCNPWDLPRKALFGEKEWYFFSPRERKYPNGARPNRAAGSGYWKATGTDKPILSAPTSESIGVKKALVFYRGKPPKGVKTDWIMHEYRLTTVGSNNKNNTKRRGSSSSMRLDDWVLCRIYKKSNNNFQYSDDQEHEASTQDSSLTNNNMNSGGVPSPKSEDAHASDDGHQFRPLSLTKSCSLTDLLNTIDYAALSQLLLLDAPASEAEPQLNHPLIHTTPACQPLTTVINNNTSVNMPQVDALCSEYGAGYNGLKRRRVLLAVDGSGTSSSFDGGSSLQKKLQLPSDSRSGACFGGSSSGSYCNQPLAEVDSSSLQYSSLLSHPFLNQQVLLNNHLEMQ